MKTPPATDLPTAPRTIAGGKLRSATVAAAHALARRPTSLSLPAFRAASVGDREHSVHAVPKGAVLLASHALFRTKTEATGRKFPGSIGEFPATTKGYRAPDDVEIDEDDIGTQLRNLLVVNMRMASQIERLTTQLADVAKAVGKLSAEHGSEPRNRLATGDDVGVRAWPKLRTVSENVMFAATADLAGELYLGLSEDPDMLGAEAFADLLGMTVQALHKRRLSGRVLALSEEKRKYWFPKWQIVKGQKKIVDGLPDVIKLFNGDMWAAYQFLARQTHPGLNGQTGREALIAGRKKQVLTVAEGLCEGGFS